MQNIAETNLEKKVQGEKMKRTCIQCGKEFELTSSEISFYKKRKLALPKRCKECRDLNKKGRSEQRMTENAAEQHQKWTDSKTQQPTVAAASQMQPEPIGAEPKKSKLIPILAAVGIVVIVCILIACFW